MMLDRDAAESLVRSRPQFREFLRSDNRMLVKVNNALYGLPESGKRWFDCLSKFLVESGY